MSIKKNTYVRERKRESKEREGMKDRKKRVERERGKRERGEREKERDRGKFVAKAQLFCRLWINFTYFYSMRCLVLLP